MKYRLCILSIALLMSGVEACCPDAPQDVEVPGRCGGNCPVKFFSGGGDYAEDGFSIIGISSDGNDLILNDIAVPESSPGAFVTAGKHNIPYGKSVDFYAVWPKEPGIKVSDGDILFIYGPEHKGLDILAGEARNFMYDGGASHNIVPLRFRHISSGLEVHVQGFDEEGSYVVKAIYVTHASSAAYNLKTSRWETLAEGGTTNLGITGERQYFIPGTIEITVQWSCFHNGIETAEYDASVPINLTMGTISSVKLVLSDRESGKIGFDVNVEPWNQTNADADFSPT